MILIEIDQEQLINSISNYGVKVAGALMILILGWLVVKLSMKVVKQIMLKSKMDKTLVSFLGNIMHVLLMAFVIIAAIDKLGVNTTSLAAVLAAAGLAVGLALKGALSNFASGVMVIILRPFKIGDFIEVASVSGTVKGVNIYSTTLTTGDNKTVIVPNAKLNSNNLTNYSTQKLRRIDLIIGIGYDDDIKKAKNIITKILTKDKRILEDPAPLVAVGELAESSINLKVRPWVEKGDYWDVYHDLNENIKIAFDKGGINIPYPQQDIHLYNTNKE